MLRVRCQAQVKIDAKGRMALPVPIRRALETAGQQQLVLAYHRGAVWGWTADVFEERIEGPLVAADQFDVEIMDFAHAWLSTAQDCEVDGQGRVRVPSTLRDLAQLDKDIVVHSIMNRLEIWDKKKWDERFVTAVGRAGDLRGMPGREG